MQSALHVGRQVIDRIPSKGECRHDMPSRRLLLNIAAQAAVVVTVSAAQKDSLLGEEFASAGELASRPPCGEHGVSLMNCFTCIPLPIHLFAQDAVHGILLPSRRDPGTQWMDGGGPNGNDSPSRTAPSWTGSGPDTPDRWSWSTIASTYIAESTTTSSSCWMRRDLRRRPRLGWAAPADTRDSFLALRRRPGRASAGHGRTGWWESWDAHERRGSGCR